MYQLPVPGTGKWPPSCVEHPETHMTGRNEDNHEQAHDEDYPDARLNVYIKD